MISFKKMVIFLALTSVIAHANINNQNSINTIIEAAQNDISQISMDSLFDVYVERLSHQQKRAINSLLLKKVLSDPKVLDRIEIRGGLIDLMDALHFGYLINTRYGEESATLTEKAQLLLCSEKLTQKQIEKIIKIFTQLADFYKKTPAPLAK